jgi:hypothetical protein
MVKIIKLKESDLRKIVNQVNEVMLGKKELSKLDEQVLNEGKKYEFINEHPSFKELNSKISELKKFMKTMGKDLVGGIDYVEEHVEDKLFNK